MSQARSCLERRQLRSSSSQSSLFTWQRRTGSEGHQTTSLRFSGWNCEAQRFWLAEKYVRSRVPWEDWQQAASLLQRALPFVCRALPGQCRLNCQSLKAQSLSDTLALWLAEGLGWFDHSNIWVRDISSLEETLSLRRNWLLESYSRRNQLDSCHHCSLLDRPHRSL